MTIQEQVERFVRLHLHVAHGEKPDFIAQQNLRALLRAFLEECCQVECPDCAEGPPEYCEKEDEYLHNNGCGCDASEIRRHFAWLEEK